MIDNFLQAELEGRTKFNLITKQNPYITDLEFTNDRYDSLDCYFRYRGKLFGVEIKNRNSYYNVWNIEVWKFEAMNNLIKQNKIQGGYFAVFYKSDCYLYDFQTIKDCYEKFGVSDMWAKKQTVINSTYTNKKIISLPVELAKIKNIWS